MRLADSRFISVVKRVADEIEAAIDKGISEVRVEFKQADSEKILNELNKRFISSGFCMKFKFPMVFLEDSRIIQIFTLPDAQSLGYISDPPVEFPQTIKRDTE